MQLAIAKAGEVHIGDRGEARSIEHTAAGHGAKRRPDEQLVRHESRDWVPGQSEDGCPGLLEYAEGEGFRRLDCDLHRTHGGPTLVLEHNLHPVAPPDAPSSARNDGIAPGPCLFDQGGQGYLFVPRHAQVDGAEAVCLKLGEERWTVGVADLPWLQVATRRDQLVAGGKNAHGGEGMD